MTLLYYFHRKVEIYSWVSGSFLHVFYYRQSRLFRYYNHKREFLMVCNSQKTSYNVQSHFHFHVRILLKRHLLVTMFKIFNNNIVWHTFGSGFIEPLKIMTII